MTCGALARRRLPRAFLARATPYPRLAKLHLTERIVITRFATRRGIDRRLPLDSEIRCYDPGFFFAADLFERTVSQARYSRCLVGFLPCLPGALALLLVEALAVERTRQRSFIRKANQIKALPRGKPYPCRYIGQVLQKRLPFRLIESGGLAWRIAGSKRFRAPPPIARCAGATARRKQLLFAGSGDRARDDNTARGRRTRSGRRPRYQRPVGHRLLAGFRRKPTARP